MQQKAIHLLSRYTLLPVGNVDQKMWKKVHLLNLEYIHIEILTLEMKL